jgi:hypothetical protein
LEGYVDVLVKVRQEGDEHTIGSGVVIEHAEVEQPPGGASNG